MIDTLTNIAISLTSFVGACSALAAAIPKPVSDGILALMHKGLNFCACNFFNAENKQ